MGEMKINGQGCAFPENKDYTILQAARDAGIYIPTLCSCEDLNVKGNCRICMVEVAGQGRLIPACATPAVDGMEVETDTPLVQKHRRTILELIMADHNRNCPGCSQNKHCDLQRIADDHDIVLEDFEEVFVEKEPVTVEGVLKIERDRCIRCGRCKALCNDQLGINAISVKNRGGQTEYQIHLNGACTLCGKCTEVCPVGALTRDTHLPATWDALDFGTANAVFVDGDFDVLEAKLVEKTGYGIEKTAGMLKNIGFEQVMYYTTDPAKTQLENVETVLEQAGADVDGVVIVTSDITYKRMIRESCGECKLRAVLAAEDLELLRIQALVDMNYV